jgi:dTDP-4-dehydrorhamnose reductase
MAPELDALLSRESLVRPMRPAGFSVRLPLLITGITGVAGFNALYYFQRRYPGQVIGIRPRQTWRLVGEGIHVLNAEDAAGLGDLFRAYRFRSVLNCVGNCALKSCECDPAMAQLLNVDSAATIVGCVSSHGSRLVHLSSDLVFSGKGGGNYVEPDPTDPVTIYGKSMVQGEVVIRDNDPSAAILRISLPMGPSFNGHAGAIDWILSRFRRGQPATLYFDEVRSCTYTEDLNPVFERFLLGSENGLFHLGGPRAVTLYQIGQIVNRVGGYDPALLKGCPRAAAGPLPPRAGNVSMGSGRLLGVLGSNPFRPWPVGADVFPTDREWHFQRLPAEQGGLGRIRERLYSAP